jgi:hypothetical protein
VANHAKIQTTYVAQRPNTSFNKVVSTSNFNHCTEGPRSYPVGDETYGNPKAATPPATIKPMPAFAASALGISIAFGLLVLISLSSLHLLEPQLGSTLGHGSRFISEYGMGRYVWMMVLASLDVATGFASASVAVFSQILTIADHVGLAKLGICAISLLIAGIFTMDSCDY